MALLPDELAPEAHETAQPFAEVGPNAGSVPGDSTKVGFTIRDTSNRIERGFSFLINPQGLTRTEGSRTQLFATKGGFYVDDFGPAPGQVTMRQLVASGKVVPGAFFTAREDVQRFLTTIYLPATRGPLRDGKHVYFHDHHFSRGFEERVYFPPNSLTIQRSVDLHNLWLLELTMVSLERFPYGEVEASSSAQRTRGAGSVVVTKGMTLHSIASVRAGVRTSFGQPMNATGATAIKLMITKILGLNPWIKKPRAIPGGGVGKPMQVYPGETVILPG